MTRVASESCTIIVEAENVNDAIDKAHDVAMAGGPFESGWTLDEGNYVDWDDIHCPDEAAVEEYLE